MLVLGGKPAIIAEIPNGGNEIGAGPALEWQVKRAFHGEIIYVDKALII
jgi:hypothetical protein